MKFDLSFIKVESVVKFEKSVNKVRDRFDEMLAMVFDASSFEIDDKKREQVELALSDLFNDEINKSIISFNRCMNKASDIIETGFIS